MNYLFSTYISRVVFHPIMPEAELIRNMLGWYIKKSYMICKIQLCMDIIDIVLNVMTFVDDYMMHCMFFDDYMFFFNMICLMHCMFFKYDVICQNLTSSYYVFLNVLLFLSRKCITKKKHNVFLNKWFFEIFFFWFHFLHTSTK